MGLIRLFVQKLTDWMRLKKSTVKNFTGEGQLFFFYKRHAYTTFLHCPVNQMTESNYMFSWPDNETLFGKTN